MYLRFSQTTLIHAMYGSRALISIPLDFGQAYVHVSAFLRVLVGKILVVPRQSLVGGSLSTRGEDKSDGVVKVKACCRFEFDIGIFIYAAEYMGNKFTGKASILLANCLTN